MSYATNVDNGRGTRGTRQRTPVAGTVGNTYTVASGPSGGEANSDNHSDVSVTEQLLDAVARAASLLKPTKEEQKKFQALVSLVCCLK